MVLDWSGIVALSLLALWFIVTPIRELRKQHSHEIYVIWYVFSFFVLLFFFLYSLAIRGDIEVTDVFGPSLAGILKFAYDCLTNIEGEIYLILGFVYLALGPQWLTYVLSGLSGTASPPMFVRQISMVAIWSLIKFMAGLAGILVAEWLAKLCWGKQVSAFDFFHAAAFICGAFFLAVMHHRLSDEDFEMEVVPGLRIRIHPPVRSSKAHEFFTRYTTKRETSDAIEVPEQEWRVNVRGGTIILSGWVARQLEKLVKYIIQRWNSSDAKK